MDEGISAEEFDRKFDNGEDMTPYVDFSKVRRPGQEPRRVNVDFPAWMVGALDMEARRLGITRQAVIKVWIGERLDQRAAAEKAAQRATAYVILDESDLPPTVAE
jgi:hypothetical protein